MVGGRGGTGQRTYRCAATQSSYPGDKCPQGAAVTADIVEAYLRDIVDQLQGELVARARASSPIDLALVESDLREAEQELDAFASDLTARRALGAGYQRHLQVRVEDRDQKLEAYRAAVRMSEATILPPSEQTLGVQLTGLFKAVAVRPGRGLKIVDRVAFHPLDADSDAGMLTA